MKYILYAIILCASATLLETYICDVHNDVYSCELITEQPEKEVIRPIMEDEWLFDMESPELIQDE
jgi:hypothetical protein